MAQGDILKMDAVTELNYIVMLNELSYIKEKQDAIKAMELRNRK